MLVWSLNKILMLAEQYLRWPQFVFFAVFSGFSRFRNSNFQQTFLMPQPYFSFYIISFLFIQALISYRFIKFRKNKLVNNRSHNNLIGYRDWLKVTIHYSGISELEIR